MRPHGANADSDAETDESMSGGADRDERVVTAVTTTVWIITELGDIQSEGGGGACRALFAKSTDACCHLNLWVPAMASSDCPG